MGSTPIRDSYLVHPQPQRLGQLQQQGLGSPKQPMKKSSMPFLRGAKNGLSAGTASTPQSPERSRSAEPHRSATAPPAEPGTINERRTSDQARADSPLGLIHASKLNSRLKESAVSAASAGAIKRGGTMAGRAKHDRKASNTKRLSSGRPQGHFRDTSSTSKASDADRLSFGKPQAHSSGTSISKPSHSRSSSATKLSTQIQSDLDRATSILSQASSGSFTSVRSNPSSPAPLSISSGSIKSSSSSSSIISQKKSKRSRLLGRRKLSISDPIKDRRTSTSAQSVTPIQTPNSNPQKKEKKWASAVPFFKVEKGESIGDLMTTGFFEKRLELGKPIQKYLPVLDFSKMQPEGEGSRARAGLRRSGSILLTPTGLYCGNRRSMGRSKRFSSYVSEADAEGETRPGAGDEEQRINAVPQPMSHLSLMEQRRVTSALSDLPDGDASDHGIPSSTSGSNTKRRSRMRMSFVPSFHENSQSMTVLMEEEEDDAAADFCESGRRPATSRLTMTPGVRDAIDEANLSLAKVIEESSIQDALLSDGFVVKTMGDETKSSTGGNVHEEANDEESNECEREEEEEAKDTTGQKGRLSWPLSSQSLFIETPDDMNIVAFVAEENRDDDDEETQGLEGGEGGEESDKASTSTTNTTSPGNMRILAVVAEQPENEDIEDAGGLPSPSAWPLPPGNSKSSISMRPMSMMNFTSVTEEAQADADERLAASIPSRPDLSWLYPDSERASTTGWPMPRSYTIPVRADGETEPRASRRLSQLSVAKSDGSMYEKEDWPDADDGRAFKHAHCSSDPGSVREPVIGNDFCARPRLTLGPSEAQIIITNQYGHRKSTESLRYPLDTLAAPITVSDDYAEGSRQNALDVASARLSFGPSEDPIIETLQESIRSEDSPRKEEIKLNREDILRLLVPEKDAWNQPVYKHGTIQFSNEFLDRERRPSLEWLAGWQPDDKSYERSEQAVVESIVDFFEEYLPEGEKQALREIEEESGLQAPVLDEDLIREISGLSPKKRIKSDPIPIRLPPTSPLPTTRPASDMTIGQMPSSPSRGTQARARPMAVHGPSLGHMLLKRRGLF